MSGQKKDGTSRRRRVDGAAGRAEVIAAAAQDVPYPTGLSLAEQNHFKSIYHAKTARAWNDFDLGMAANLAKSLAQVDLLMRSTDPTDIKLTNSVMSRCRQLAGMLQITSICTNGSAKKNVKQNQVHKQARESIASAQSASGFSGLIPGVH